MNKVMMVFCLMMTMVISSFGADRGPYEAYMKPHFYHGHLYIEVYKDASYTIGETTLPGGRNVCVFKYKSSDQVNQQLSFIYTAMQQGNKIQYYVDDAILGGNVSAITRMYLKK